MERVWLRLVILSYSYGWALLLKLESTQLAIGGSALEARLSAMTTNRVASVPQINCPDAAADCVSKMEFFIPLVQYPYSIRGQSRIYRCPDNMFTRIGPFQNVNCPSSSQPNITGSLWLGELVETCADPGNCRMPVIAGHATASSLFSFPRTCVGLRKHYPYLPAVLISLTNPPSNLEQVEYVAWARPGKRMLGRCFGNEPFQLLAQPHPLKILGPLEIPSASQPHGCGLSHGPSHVCMLLPAF